MNSDDNGPLGLGLMPKLLAARDHIAKAEEALREVADKSKELREAGTDLAVEGLKDAQALGQALTDAVGDVLARVSPKKD